MLFEFLNILNVSSTLMLAGVHALAGLNIHAAETYNYGPELEEAREFRGKPHMWNAEYKGCRFSGVMVPFSRTWEEKVMRGSDEVVSPPMPDKLLGHAILLNRKQCGDAAPVKIMRIGAEPRSLGFQRMVEGKMVITYDLGEMTRDQLPPWLPQVMERLEKLSKVAGVPEAVSAFVTDVQPDWYQAKVKLGLADTVQSPLNELERGGEATADAQRQQALPSSLVDQDTNRTVTAPQ